MKKTVGVLALQGAFARHMDIFENLGAEAVEVREPADLPGLDALVLPGGESTTMSKMLLRWELIKPIQVLIAGGLPVFGTCAGLILLADHLVDWENLPRPGGLNLTVARNAYGRQIDSFEAALEIEVPGYEELSNSPFNGVFIRAPRIVPGSTGENVELFCTFEGHPVLVRQGNIVGASFHPELTDDNRLHRWFLHEIVNSWASGTGKQAG